MIVLIINSILLAIILVAMILFALQRIDAAFWGLLALTTFFLAPMLLTFGFYAYALEGGLLVP